MREFNSVLIKNDVIKQVIDFDELKNSPDLTSIKHSLYCPIKDCDAKLIWVNAKHPYLKSAHNEDHNPSKCPHYREKGVPFHRPSQRSIPVNLPPDGILARLDRLAPHALPSNKKKVKKNNKHASRREAHKIDTDVKRITVHGQLSDSSTAILTSKIPTRIQIRQINSITDKDIGSTFQIFGQIKQIDYIESKQVFHILISSNHSNLLLILGKKYFVKESTYKNKHVYEYILANYSSLRGPIGIGCLPIITNINDNKVVIGELTRAHSIKFFCWDEKYEKRHHYTPLEFADKLKKDDQ